MYGMFTDAGNNAVAAIVSEYLNRGTPIKKSEIEDLVEEIQARVEEMGKGKSNKSKYDDEMIEGFYEVDDTVCREYIFEALHKGAIDG